MMTEALANLNDNDNVGYLLLLIKRNIYWFQSFVTVSCVGTAENLNGFCEQNTPSQPSIFRCKTCQTWFIR
mgnify:FL=1